MELATIEKLGYPSYFLIVKEIRDWANTRLGTGDRRPTDCTILRGSAANSITFYNIGVSDLDPIRYDLYFQRFLNEDRASPPDADLDFGWDERDEVQKFIAERWGQERVAATCTTNHFRERAAVLLPNRPLLLQPYPNPFNAGTVILLALPAPASVELVVHNLLGQVIRVLRSQSMPAGVHRILWNGRDEDGRVARSGVYFVVLDAAGQRSVQRLLLVH